MEQADRLSISFNWHPPNEPLGRSFNYFYPHLLIKGPAPAFADQFKEIRLRHSE
jgi:hypothetical protein